jgi:hypothetical protein
MTRHVRMVPLIASVLLTLSLGACAVRLGGPSPQEYSAVAAAVPAGMTATQVGEQLRAVGADVVLLAAEQDTSWFAEVGAETRLTLGRPGVLGGRAYAFLSRLELLGDTTMTLSVPDGGTVAMHDALYRIDQYRYLNTMTVRIDAPDLRRAVQTLFGYIATDVMADAAVLLAVDGPTAAVADSIALLMRAHYTTASDCESATLPPELPVRLLYGPAARISCRSAQPLAGGVPAIQARVIVGR